MNKIKSIEILALGEKFKEDVMKYIWYFESLGIRTHTNLIYLNGKRTAMSNLDKEMMAKSVTESIMKSNMVLLVGDTPMVLPHYIAESLKFFDKKVITDNPDVYYYIESKILNNSPKSINSFSDNPYGYTFYDLTFHDSILIVYLDGINNMARQLLDIINNDCNNKMAVDIEHIKAINIGKLPMYKMIIVVNDGTEDQYIKQINEIIRLNKQPKFLKESQLFNTNGYDNIKFTHKKYVSDENYNIETEIRTITTVRLYDVYGGVQ